MHGRDYFEGEGGTSSGVLPTTTGWLLAVVRGVTTVAVLRAGGSRKQAAALANSLPPLDYSMHDHDGGGALISY